MLTRVPSFNNKRGNLGVAMLLGLRDGTRKDKQKAQVAAEGLLRVLLYYHADAEGRRTAANGQRQDLKCPIPIKHTGRVCLCEGTNDTVNWSWLGTVGRLGKLSGVSQPPSRAGRSRRRRSNSFNLSHFPRAFSE